MKIVIIGLGAGGFSAAFSARKQNKEASISVVDNKYFDLLHRCAMPFYLEGKIKDIDHLKEDLKLDSMNITKYSHSEVIDIDPKEKFVEIKNLKTENTEKLEYDSLILAVGSKPFVPDIKGSENALVVEYFESLQKIKKESGKAKNAVIIGAGAIGLEMGYALKKQGLKVTIVDIMDKVMARILDEDIAEELEEYMKSEEINFLLGKNIDEIKKDRVVVDGVELKSELTLISTGVKANIQLADIAGVEIGKKGIKVNDKFETSAKGIYAIGDCVENFSLIDKKEFMPQLASIAFNQGKIAGCNAAGGKAKYEGSLGTFVTVIGKNELAATGFNSSYAADKGHDVIVGKVNSYIKPEWFPGAKKLTLKVIADKKSGKILGAQAFGEEGAAARINIISTAIKAGLTLEDMQQLELAYCPSVSNVKDVLIMAVEFAMRKL